jgi:hypothetical protein
MHLINTCILLALIVTTASCGTPKSTATRAPSCERIVIDMEHGTIDDTTACGRRLFYANDGFTLYPDRNALSVMHDFTGVITLPGYSMSEREAKNYYGEPVRSETEGEYIYRYYQRPFGTMVVQFIGEKARKFELHATSPAETVMCVMCVK